MSRKDAYRKMTIELSPQAHKLVDALLKTGLFGLTRAEVVERFVCEKLREHIDVPLLIIDEEKP